MLLLLFAGPLAPGSEASLKENAKHSPPHPVRGRSIAAQLIQENARAAFSTHQDERIMTEQRLRGSIGERKGGFFQVSGWVHDD